MPKCLEVYKCNLCGNIVENIHAGDGALVCCGEEMVLLTENTVDAAKVLLFWNHTLTCNKNKEILLDTRV